MIYVDASVALAQLFAEDRYDDRMVHAARRLSISLFRL